MSLDQLDAAVRDYEAAADAAHAVRLDAVSRKKTDMEKKTQERDFFSLVANKFQLQRLDEEGRAGELQAAECRLRIARAYIRQKDPETDSKALPILQKVLEVSLGEQGHG